jgi:hypothetical protein
MTTRNWQTTNFRVVNSYLTGRSIYINDDPDLMLIPPTFTVDELRRALDGMDAYLRTVKKGCLPTRPLRSVLDSFRCVSTVEEFGVAVDNLLASQPPRSGANTDPARVRDMLVCLWQAGCLVWAMNTVDRFGGTKLADAWGLGDRVKETLSEFDRRQSEFGATSGRLRALLVLFLCRGGACGAGDLTPEITEAYFQTDMKSPQNRHSVASTLLALQESEFGARIEHSLEDFGTFGRQAVRADNTFSWASTTDATTEEWRTLAEEFIGLLTGGINARRGGLNSFLDYLIANPSLPRTPADYLRSSYMPNPPFSSENKTNQNAVAAFLDFILDTRCVAEDDLGGKLRLPGFRNPVMSVRASQNNGETHRNPMPTRFVRMLREILTENDFAWPKATGRVNQGNRPGRGDWFECVDPTTGVTTEIWSPVRTVTILLKLMLPALTYQVRVLDSGEADSEIYHPGKGWSQNRCSFAPPPKARVARGVLHRHRNSRDGTEKVFLRFNTNKTADINKEAPDAGYVMPWEHEEAIALLAWLRDWQATYNPLTKPTKWADLNDIEFRSAYTKEALERRGEACFLFRDPVAKDKDQPISDGRLVVFWRRLCAELENRLATIGETLADGSPIKLVERREDGQLGPAVFDLHSLRVTIITALTESGGVPADILIKVVGHASVLMTLYYQKISPSHISERLNASEHAIRREEQTNWQRWLVDKDRETLIQAVAFVGPSGLDAMVAVTATSWVDREHGICPVGCSRCHEGGEKLVDTAAYQRWGEVPGGPSNCVRCRFFIGPVFLNGLQANFDSVSFRLREASARYQAAKTKFENLESEYNIARERGEPIPPLNRPKAARLGRFLWSFGYKVRPTILWTRVCYTVIPTYPTY